ncbi:MAG: hypothetical protein ACI4SG_01125 [Oligosphaeraceae bacterium]
MPVSSLLLLYTLLALLGGLLLLLAEKLWFSNHNWHLSRSKLLTCSKCGNVFSLARQSVDRRCPLCGGRTQPFQMPYSGIHETLKQRARHLKES